MYRNGLLMGFEDLVHNPLQVGLWAGALRPICGLLRGLRHIQELKLSNPSRISGPALEDVSLGGCSPHLPAMWPDSLLG